MGVARILFLVWALFMVALVGGGIALVVHRVRSARDARDTLEATYREVGTASGLAPAEHPLGMSDAELAGTFRMLERGDGEFSAVWGMQGPARVVLGGAEVVVEACVFEWWWEFTAGTNNSQHRADLQVALLRMPPPVDMPSVAVSRQGRLSGSTDFQVESTTLNDQLHIRVADRERAIRLFDPTFQVALLERWSDWSLELVGDLALLCPHVPTTHWSPNPGVMPRRGRGGPFDLGQRDADRVGEDPTVIRRLPGVGRDAMALLADMPASWWRAVGVGDAGEMG